MRDREFKANEEHLIDIFMSRLEHFNGTYYPLELSFSVAACLES